MPINEFIRLQIAGDITGDKTDAIATGFFASAPPTGRTAVIPIVKRRRRARRLMTALTHSPAACLASRALVLVATITSSIPFLEQDYYSLAGVFNNTAAHNRPLADQEVVDRVNRHRKTVGDLNKQTKALQQKLKQEARKATESEQAQLDAWRNALSSLKENPPPGYDTSRYLCEKLAART